MGVFCPTCVGGVENGGCRHVGEIFCLFYETEAHRFDGRLGAVGHIKLLEDRFGVPFDGVDADAKGVADCLIGHPFDQKLQHILFTGGEAVMVWGCGVGID